MRVRTPEPREDVVVALAVRGADGCWWHHAVACPLAGLDNQGNAEFADFSPAEWIAPAQGSFRSDTGVLQRHGITALAIGIIDPRGIGVVNFELTEVALLSAALVAPVTIVIYPQWLEIAGTTAIPAGVFGGYHLDDEAYPRYRLALRRWIHHTGLAGDPAQDPRVPIAVTTVGDRVRPSPRLTHADWQQRCQKYGSDFGSRSAQFVAPPWVEYWNEPYLNWANRNRAAFIPHYFELAQAREGGPVHLAMDGSVCPHLRWTRQFDVPPWPWTRPQHWRRGIDATGQQWSVHAPPWRGMEDVYGGAYNETWHPPEHIADGESYDVTWQGETVQLSAMTPWHIYDETQFTFWAGAGLVRFYVEPLRVFAQALKAACPHALVIAGWQHRPGEDRWAAWDLLYRPTIDQTIDLIDAVSDHDYGGDPLRMAAQAELVACYGLVTHNKKLRSINTENAAGADPEQTPAADPLAQHAATDAIKARWCWRKIISLLALVPDKVLGCCWFGGGPQWFSAKGEGLALDLLRGLRGRLVRVESSDPQILVVAAEDQDPQRPADLPPVRTCLAILNVGQDVRDCSISVPSDSVVIRRICAGVISDTAHSCADGMCSLQLEPREAVVLFMAITFRSAPVQRHQQVWPVTLVWIGPATPSTAPVKIPAGRRRWLRVVVERLPAGVGWLEIAGVRLSIPAACTATEQTAIRELALPETVPAGGYLATFTCAQNAASWHLVCASVWWENDAGGREN